MKSYFSLLLSVTIMTWVPVVCCYADDNPTLQFLPEYMPQAPNAQAIARAIDIPVNHYTGIPNISIPLYNIEVGDLSVPITLTYQGGGIRPSQEATSVGLGWNLNAGGAITRTVKCADDFMEHQVTNAQYTVGFLGRREWPSTNNSVDASYYRSYATNPNGFESYLDYYLYVDSEPDIFFYSVPHHSGKFSFKKDTTIVLYDKSDNVKIHPLLGSTPRPFFNVIDAQGTCYCFNVKEYTHVYSCPTGGNVNTTPDGVDVTPVLNTSLTEVSDYASTWYLSQMLSSTNDTIDFEYEDECFWLPLQEICRNNEKISEGPTIGDLGVVYSGTKTEVEGKRLNRISWRGGHVDFIYGEDRADLKCFGDTAQALTDVKVYNSCNNLVGHWKMFYSYFNGERTDIPRNRRHLFNRLRLDSLRNMLDEQAPYRFTYYDKVQMPVKNTKNLDYWGYYNGSNQGSNYYCDPSSVSNKAADDNYGKIGILESMSHPTDGTTNFHWESNEINETISVDEYVKNSNHDSFTQGYLQANKNINSGYEEVNTKAVLLNENTELYLLLASEYVGSQTCPSSGGIPFTIEKVNSDGTYTSCYSWAVTAVGDEMEQTVNLAPGTYVFKCRAVVDDITYSMFFIDGHRKDSVKKSNEETLYCYNGDEPFGFPETDSQTVTLGQGNIVYFDCYNALLTENPTPNFSNVYPFSILKRNSNGVYETYMHWAISDYDIDERKTVHLDAGTYKFKCDAVIDDVFFSMIYSYGDINYTPINTGSLGNSWKGTALLAYRANNVANLNNIPECESDTITLNSPTRMFFDWFYEKESSSVSNQDFFNTCPVNIYKKSPLGVFEKLYSVPACCFADMHGTAKEASGLYLSPGTYLVKCEATAEDVLFCLGANYRSDGIYSSNGMKRGGLRIAHVEGEKNITYLYEGGIQTILPCTQYDETRFSQWSNDINTIIYSTSYTVMPSESVRPLSTMKNGNVIGYSRVVEIYSDNSRTEYTFHNEEEGLEYQDYPYSPSIVDWENGLLLSKSSYDSNGDLLAQTFNSYLPVVTTDYYKIGFGSLWPGNEYNYFGVVKCPMLTQSTYREYRTNGDYVVHHSFSYNDNLLCSEETRQIGSDTYKTVYKYADDFTDDMSQLMVETHRIGIPIAQLSMRNGLFYKGTRIVFGNFNQLTDNSNTVICGTRTWSDPNFCEMYLPKYLLTLNTSNAASSFSTCLFDTTVVYNSYTRYGKVQELNYKGMPITYLWSYNGMYPVAEVKNATCQQFMSHFSNPSLLQSNSFNIDPEYVRDRLWDAGTALNNVSVEVCLYKPLVGLTEITDNRGVRNTFSYDQAARLTSVRINSANVSLNELLQNFSYGKNVVRSNIFPTYETSNGIRSIQYYDAWGRPSLSACQGVRQNGTFTYSLQIYDGLGRPSLSYVPIPSSSISGDSISSDTFIGMSANAFSGDRSGFVRTSYDNLGRTVETTTPGMSWYNSGKTSTIQYLTNVANEVKCYSVSGSSLAQNGYYAAATLDCTLTTDPDGLTVKSYKDVFGNVVLERRAGNYDTYYVYDNFNRLRFVLPPKYQVEANLGYYAYKYEYDGRGRVSKKTLPGCQPVQYWYDNADRLIKMQDGVLAQSGQYRVWTYDGLGRQLTQGIETGGNLTYYEMKNYYDNYNFISSYSSLFPSGVSNLLPANYYNGRGQQTGVWQRTNDGGSMLSVLGYDEMGFLSKKTEAGSDGKLSVSDYTNNLIGDVTQESFRKYKPNTTTNTLECLARGSIENNYDYQHTNLLHSSVITIYDKNNNMRTDTIQNLTYDDFGHVMTNDRSGTAADMTYEYDQMHGWLRSIRSSKWFEQNLYRETEGQYPRYNGNISAMSWKTDNGWLRRFDYQYNDMNWLTHADFSYYRITNASPGLPPTLTLIPYVGSDNEDYTSMYYYDKNGNLTGAYRQGYLTNSEDEDNYDTMDDYNVEYYGNQKRSVNGQGYGTPCYYGSSAFIDGMPDGDNEYAYNGNGAMTKDLNKGITNISYDLLGNMQEITMSGNRKIRYAYAADGTRLKTVHRQWKNNTWLRDSTEYFGNLIIKNGIPSMYRFGGGYYAFNNGLLSDCHFYIQDYLGSNRMVVNKNGTVKQTTHYYPYGGIIGGKSTYPEYQTYKHTDKELDRTYGLEWYDVLARQYDPVVPSWHTIDPLAEKYYYISPYAYCANNPVNAIDLDGRKTYLYATTLPGSSLPFATHTFITVEKNNKVVGYYAYGSEKDGFMGAFSGQLVRREYNQDKAVFSGKDKEHLKIRIPVNVPNGMTQDMFDDKVSEVAESFGNVQGINYFMAPLTPTQGNCNTSTSTILLKAGVSKEQIKEIKDQIPGLSYGFSENENPWTEQEQKDAVRLHYEMEESLDNIIR